MSLKMKTHRGACKRFKKRGSGSIKRKQMNHRHLFAGRSRKKIRNSRDTTSVHKTNFEAVSRMIGEA